LLPRRSGVCSATGGETTKLALLVGVIVIGATVTGASIDTMLM